MKRGTGKATEFRQTLLSAHCGSTDSADSADSAAKPAGVTSAIHGIEGDAVHLRVRDPAVRNRDVFNAADHFRAELNRMTAARLLATGGDDAAARPSGAGRLSAHGIFGADEIAVADADVFAGIQFDAVIIVVPLVAAPDGHPLDHGTFGLEKKFNVHAPGLVSRKFLTVTLVQRTQRSRNGDPSIAGLQFAAGGILGRRYPK